MRRRTKALRSTFIPRATFLHIKFQISKSIIQIININCLLRWLAIRNIRSKCWSLLSCSRLARAGPDRPLRTCLILHRVRTTLRAPNKKPKICSKSWTSRPSFSQIETYLTSKNGSIIVLLWSMSRAPRSSVKMNWNSWTSPQSILTSIPRSVMGKFC